MTFDDVRRIALALPEAEERVTWETDITFRVRDKIFAIGGEGATRVSIKASLETQAELVELDPATFAPSAYTGRFGWVTADLAAGRRGPADEPAPRGVATIGAEEARRDPGGLNDETRTRRVRRSRAEPAATSRITSAGTGPPGTAGPASTSPTASGAGGSGRATRSGGSGTSRSASSSCCRTTSPVATRSSSAAGPPTCRPGSPVAAPGRSGSTTPRRSSRRPAGSRPSTG